MSTTINKTENNPDYKRIALSIFIPIVGFLSGWFAHHKFNPFFEESEALDNWVLPARYSVGYTSILPAYLLIAYQQRLRNGDKTPLWDRLTDFIIAGFVVGCGVMFGRLFGKR